MLALQNISFEYPNGKKLFSNLNYNIAQSGLYYVIGPEGCGKSTLLRIIAMQQKPTFGAVIFMSKNIYALTGDQKVSTARYIGYSPQANGLIENATVLENLQISAAGSLTYEQKDNKRAYMVIQSLKLEGISSLLIRDISQTQRERVAVGCSLVKKPKMIILDEPVASMSHESSIDFINIFSEMAASGINKGIVVIIATNKDELIADDNANIINLGEYAT